MAVHIFKKKRKTALVLAGSAAHGAFQMAAEKYAREVKGHRWDVIAGISIGAFNGAMLALKKHERLERIWSIIKAKDFYLGKLNWWSAFKIMLGSKSIYNNMPFWHLINHEIDPHKIKMDMRVGIVSLRTGKYVIFKPNNPGFNAAILASSSMPLVFPPKDIAKALPDMVDGSLSNVSFMGNVLDTEPDEIVIINSDAREQREKVHFKNALDIGQRALEIATTEIFHTDIKQFIRSNYTVWQAAQKGMQLKKETGEELRYYKYRLIEPRTPLPDMLDFSPASISYSMKQGWETAKYVLG